MTIIAWERGGAQLTYASDRRDVCLGLHLWCQLRKRSRRYDEDGGYFYTTLLNAAGGGDRDPLSFLGLGRGPPTHRVCRRTILHQIRHPHGRLPAGSYGSAQRCVSRRESHMACWHAPPARADGVTCPHASGDAGLRKARTAMRHVRTPPATLAYAGRVLPWSWAIARGTRQNGRYLRVAAY